MEAQRAKIKYNSWPYGASVPAGNIQNKVLCHYNAVRLMQKHPLEKIKQSGGQQEFMGEEGCNFISIKRSQTSSYYTMNGLLQSTFFFTELLSNTKER